MNQRDELLAEPSALLNLTSTQSNVSYASANQPLSSQETLPAQAGIAASYQMLSQLLTALPTQFERFKALFETIKEHLTLEKLQDLIAHLEKHHHQQVCAEANEAHRLLKTTYENKSNPKKPCEEILNPLKRPIQKKVSIESPTQTRSENTTASSTLGQNKQKLFDIVANIYNNAWETWDKAEKCTDQSIDFYSVARVAYENYRDLLLCWNEEDQRAYIQTFPNAFQLSDKLTLKQAMKALDCNTVSAFIKQFLDGQIALIHRAPEKTKNTTSLAKNTASLSLFSKSARKKAIEKSSKIKSQSKRQHRQTL